MYIRSIFSFRISDTFWRYCKPILIWVCGFFFGSLIASYAEPYVFSMVLRASKSPMSIDGLLTVYFLPFLITAAASRLKHNFGLMAVCFVEAFSYAYLLSCFVNSMKSAWLLLPLYFFADLYISVFLLWKSARFSAVSTKSSMWIPFFVTVAVACLDFFAISPFLAAIVS